MSNSINIKFPFQDSTKGFFMEMSEDNDSAVKNDLLHLLLTQKGERYYLPDFGSDLRKYVFEPNDGITYSEMEQDLNETIKAYIPNITINKIHIDRGENSEYIAKVRIDYVFVEGVFESKDYVILEF
jgi:phage baseplate assembly protein W